jgi:putative colanic acid biosynthesis acetyltransferase WcaF
MIPDLSAFDNSWYTPGRSRFVQALWFFLGAPLLACRIIPSSRFRAALLRLFGARIGGGAVIKPGVRVKYPWLLWAGDHCWIGEDAWIDNLAPVTLGSHVCISQGAYLCTGNHDWSDPAFGLMAQPIVLDSGAWVGARSVICPGVSLGESAIAVAGSVIAKDIPPHEIHAGNPGCFVRMRQIHDALPVDQPVLRA